MQTLVPQVQTLSGVMHALNKINMKLGEQVSPHIRRLYWLMIIAYMKKQKINVTGTTLSTIFGITGVQKYKRKYSNIRNEQGTLIVRM